MKRITRALLFLAIPLVGIASLLTAGDAWMRHRQLKEMHARLEPPLDQRVVDAGSLRDVRGNRRPLVDFPRRGALVLTFLGANCRLSNLYLEKIVELERSYRDRGVQFLALYPNRDETSDIVAAHALDHEIPFPVVHDEGQRQADSLGVTVTPEVCVIDRGFVLRYRGPVDQSAAVDTPRVPDASRENLEDAIAEVLRDRWVTVPMARAEGDPLRRTVPASAGASVTFHRDVAPILQRRCQACHRPYRSAPFSLLTLADVRQRGDVLAEVIEERRMPPWHADGRYGAYSNDRRLSHEEMETFAAWFEQGMPEGNPAEAPPPIQWPIGWSIGVPDVVIEAPKAFRVPATGQQIIDYSTVPSETTDMIFAEDRWVAAAEVLPGEPAVVHHISVYVVWPGQEPPPKNLDGRNGILGWAPGEPAYVFPPGSALWVPKGSRLVFEIHYVPNGRELDDRSRVGLVFAQEKPKRRLILISPGRQDLAIEPNEPHHRDQFEFTFPSPYRLLGLMGHMHLRGKAYSIDAIFPDGKRETLLRVPRYDFYWQTFYWLKQPVTLPRGTRLVETGWWDNSVNNPNNPDPAAKVKQGPASTDEMLTCWMFLEEES